MQTSDSHVLILSCQSNYFPAGVAQCSRKRVARSWVTECFWHHQFNVDILHFTFCAKCLRRLFIYCSVGLFNTPQAEVRLQCFPTVCMWIAEKLPLFYWKFSRLWHRYLSGTVPNVFSRMFASPESYLPELLLFWNGLLARCGLLLSSVLLELSADAKPRYGQNEGKMKVDNTRRCNRMLVLN